MLFPRITNSEKYGLGTSFKSRVFRDKNTLSIIVRSFVPMDEIKKQFLEESFAIQQYLALAALDEVYGLEF